MSALKRSKPSQQELEDFYRFKESIDFSNLVLTYEQPYMFTIMDVIHDCLPDKYDAVKSPLDNFCDYIYRTITDPNKTIYNHTDVPEKDKKEWTKKVCACEIPQCFLDMCIHPYNEECEDKFRMKSDNFNMIILENSKNLLDYVLYIFANCAQEDFELDAYFKDKVIPVEPVFNKVVITIRK